MSPYDLEQEFVTYKGAIYYVDEATDEEVNLILYRGKGETFADVPWKEHKKMVVITKEEAENTYEFC